jgi:hypothetical protein
MAEKEIALLKEQIERLQEKKFDLEAWKIQTMIYLERIFGKDSTKVKLIRDLHYDYSSWNLRDTAGAGRSGDPVKFQAQGILQATVEELEKLGMPEGRPDSSRLHDLLRDELTGKQVREIDNILNTEMPDKLEKIAGMLEQLEKEALSRMLARLLLP